MFNNQILAISYRFAEMELTKNHDSGGGCRRFGFHVVLAWPAACLSRERSSTIARNFGDV